MDHASQPKLERYARLSQIFTPNAPVNQKDLFRGRLEQIFQISSILSQPGQHAVLYGERGVGKTSLANLLSEFLFADITDEEPVTSARINCTTHDDFRSIWTKVFRELRLELPPEWKGATPDPDDIRWALADLRPRRLIVLDEFDRVEDNEALSLMADTIKALSDHLIPTKVIIVGVADSIDQLIGEHESVQRAVEEVPMPRMSHEEILLIIDKGLEEVDMTADNVARLRISRMAAGLPHYAHLLTLHAAQHAVLDDRDELGPSDVESAIHKSVRRHSLLREYHVATQSPRPDNLFSRVLAACALADKNDLGYFTARAVREPMKRITGRNYEIAAFAPHLNAFSEIDRGCVLRKEGRDRRFTYRFRNPLLQPFAIFAALADGIIPEDYVKELYG